MRLVKAKLIKRITDDGICDIRDEIPIGTTYYVDLDSIRILTWGIREQKGIEIKRESIYASNRDTGRDGFLPTELLEFERNVR